LKRGVNETEPHIISSSKFPLNPFDSRAGLGMLLGSIRKLSILWQN
jgi:hypothetical protein